MSKEKYSSKGIQLRFSLDAWRAIGFALQQDALVARDAAKMFLEQGKVEDAEDAKRHALEVRKLAALIDDEIDYYLRLGY